MSSIDVKTVNGGSQQLPSYATELSAGMDLRADISEPVLLSPLERRLFPTNIHIQLPKGYTALVCPRSGLALKNGITCLNTPGVIDADYTGAVGVLLINLSSQAVEIKPGDRIAQMVIVEHATANLIAVKSLDDTERGNGGWGHTGKN